MNINKSAPWPAPQSIRPAPPSGGLLLGLVLDTVGDPDGHEGPHRPDACHPRRPVDSEGLPGPQRRGILIEQGQRVPSRQALPGPARFWLLMLLPSEAATGFLSPPGPLGVNLQ